MYKLNKNSVTRLADGASIPFADGNRDYEEYKQWLSEGNTHEPEFTEAELQAKALAEALSEAKQAKKLALDSITVTTSSGNTFDGNETARINMVSAIAVADIAGITEKEWKLADNSIKVITLNELKEALLLSIQKVGDIVL